MDQRDAFRQDPGSAKAASAKPFQTGILQESFAATAFQDPGPTAAGKMKVAGDLRRNESIHYVPLPQTMQSYLALDVHDTHMDLRNVLQSNLARKGPDSAGAEELRYQNIFPTLTTGSVELVVKALTLYQPKKPGNNGNIGEVGFINLRGGESTTFLFKFVDTFTHSKNVILEKLFFSNYDIDTVQGIEDLEEQQMLAKHLAELVQTQEHHRRQLGEQLKKVQDQLRKQMIIATNFDKHNSFTKRAQELEKCCEEITKIDRRQKSKMHRQLSELQLPKTGPSA